MVTAPTRAWHRPSFSLVGGNPREHESRTHLIRFRGVLAPHAKPQAAIVPGRPEAGDAQPADENAQHPARMSWARLLKRVLDIELERCPNCGCGLKLVAATKDPDEIGQIPMHFGATCVRAATHPGVAASVH